MSRASVATMMLFAAAPLAAASTKVNAGPTATEPVVLAGPGDELIVFFKGSAGYSLARLDRHGNRVFGPSYVDASPFGTYSSAVAWSGNRIGWLYEAKPNGNDSEIWFHTLDADGAMTSSPVPLNQAPTPQMGDIEWVGGEFLAGYRADAGTRVMIRRLSESGSVLSPEIVARTSATGLIGMQVARVQSSLVAAWLHYVDAQTEFIEGASFDLGGNRTSLYWNYLQAQPGNKAILVDLLSRPGAAVLMTTEWSFATTFVVPLQQTHLDSGAQVTFGPSDVTEYLLPIGGFTPADAPEGYVVGWSHRKPSSNQGQIWLRRISEDGGVASPSFPASDIPDGTGYGSWSIAYNARAIGVAWQDMREGISGEYDIYFSAVPAYEAIVAGAGPSPSAPPRVQLHQPESPGAAVVSVIPYGSGGYGANAGVSEIDGDDPDELLTGPGPGASYGPQVRAFEWKGTPKPKVNFYAYGTLRYGAGVAGAHLDGDRYQEILTGAGRGAVFGPHVRGFTFDNNSVQPMPKVSFFAYGTLRYGVNAVAGDVEGDGFGEILTGPGPSAAFGAQLRGFDYDGTAVQAIAGINAFVFAGLTHGLHVASGDTDFDDIDEIAAARGPSPAGDSVVAVYGYDGGPLAELPGSRFEAFAGSLGGARLSFGQWDTDFHRELLASRGPLPGSPCEVRSFDDAARTFRPLASFDPYPAQTHGSTLSSIFVGF